MLQKRAFAALVLSLSCPLAACQSSEALPSQSERAKAVTVEPQSAPDLAAPEGSNRPASIELTPAKDAGELDSSGDGSVMTLADAEAPDGGEAGAAPACPDDMARIGRYCVDRWEAHLVSIGPDDAESPWPHTKLLEKGVRYAARASAGAFPQAYISRIEAKAACEGAGKRLCSRAEWIRACKGKHGLRYPYGNDGKKQACNTGKIHLLERFYGKSRRAWTYEAFNNPELDQQPGFLAKSGDYQVCTSDEGVSDMVGNLHEWVSDTVDEDILDILDRDQVERKTQPWKVGNAIFMGGFFSTTVEHGPGCVYTTIAHEPKYHDYSTGFRCCMDVPGLEKAGRKKKTTK